MHQSAAILFDILSVFVQLFYLSDLYFCCNKKVMPSKKWALYIKYLPYNLYCTLDIFW